MGRSRFETVEEYYEAQDPESRGRLEEIRRLALELVPEAVECLSYQMPALRRGRIFLYYAAFKHHIGLYPPVVGDESLQADLVPYRGEKGNLKFQKAEPLPLELIRRVIQALLLERGGKLAQRSELGS